MPKNKYKDEMPKKAYDPDKYVRDYQIDNPSGKGRKSTLTPEIHEAVIAGVKKGNYITTVVDALGIPRGTYLNWRYKGKSTPIHDDQGNIIGEEYPDDIYGNFVRDLMQAVAHSEMEAVTALESHFEKDWRAAAEFLSRKFPERWNPKAVVEMTGADGGPIQVEDKRESLYAQLDRIIDTTKEIEQGAEVLEAEVLDEDSDTDPEPANGPQQLSMGLDLDED